MEYTNQKNCHLMMWESDTKKRNANNKISFYVASGTKIETGDVIRATPSNGFSPVSSYVIQEVLEQRQGSISDYDDMIHYNNPEFSMQRQEVKPLSMDEMTRLVEHFNMIRHMRTDLGETELQRLIWDYENLSHMREYSQKWIDVSDALPLFYNPVMVVTDKGYVTQAIYSNQNEWTEYYIGSLLKVTHFMPLPEPPKTK